jgi:hypothetical protein
MLFIILKIAKNEQKFVENGIKLAKIDKKAKFAIMTLSNKYKIVILLPKFSKSMILVINTLTLGWCTYLDYFSL